MRKLARWCFTHRRAVVLGWLVALIGLTALHSAVGSAYSDNFRLSGTQSFDAVNLLERNAPRASGDTEQIVIAVDHGRVTDPAVRSQVEKLLAAVARQPHVTQISSPYGPRGAAQISPSGQVAFANATFDVQSNKIKAAAAKNFVAAAQSGSGHGVDVEVEGQVAQAARQQGAGGLPFGFLAAGVVLFLVFGSLLATALPLVTAALSLGTAVAAIGLLSHLIQMASFSNELSLLIGLGVGVDYALFIVTRYRQGLLRGLSGEDAVVEALDTSGRAVLFAGMIVCIAMLGMFALGVSFLYGVAVAASIAVAFTVIAALTLLPAMLGFFGRRVLRRRDRRALADGKLRTSDESRRVGALGRLDQQAPGAVRRGLRRHPRAARDPLPVDAPRFGRLGLRSGWLDHPQGVRPARQGLRPRLQRAAPACRAGDGPGAGGAVLADRAGRGRYSGRRRLDPPDVHPKPGAGTFRRRARRRIPEGLAAGRLDLDPAPHRPRQGDSSGRRAAPACTSWSADRRRSSTTSPPSCRASCRCSSRS